MMTNNRTLSGDSGVSLVTWKYNSSLRKNEKLVIGTLYGKRNNSQERYFMKSHKVRGGIGAIAY